MKPKNKQDFLVLNRIENGRNVSKVELDRKSIVTSGLMKQDFARVKKYKTVFVSPDLYEQLEKL